MPPDWAEHQRSWMAWPNRPERWGERFDNACVEIARLIHVLRKIENLTVIVPPRLEREARLQLGPEVNIIVMDLNDGWVRDTGPAFLIDGRGNAAGVTWAFNGWGNEVHDYDSDDALGGRLLEELGLTGYDGRMVMEASAVCADGIGTLLLQENSILNDNRNPILDHRQVEERLALTLGVRRLLWLPAALPDDPAGGHIANVARFVGPATVLCAVPGPDSDDRAQALWENVENLQSASDGMGRSLEVMEIPLPGPAFNPTGTPLGRSYTSFYCANGAVLVPQFGDPQDGAAVEILSRCFPSREILPVPAAEISAGGGSLQRLILPQPKA